MENTITEDNAEAGLVLPLMFTLIMTSTSPEAAK